MFQSLISNSPYTNMCDVWIKAILQIYSNLIVITDFANHFYCFCLLDDNRQIHGGRYTVYSA